MGIVYRTWQFWQALLASPSANDLELVRSVLSPEQIRLFELMQSEEQVHCIKVARRLLEKQHDHPDLLAAALLHDVGKINHPLQLWERAWLVIGNAFFPKQVSRWRREPEMDANKKNNWRRAFLVYAQHPVWGAALARKAGASSLCVNLISRHQDRYPLDPNFIEDQLLLYLQEADNLS